MDVVFHASSVLGDPRIQCFGPLLAGNIHTIGERLEHQPVAVAAFVQAKAEHHRHA